jgi:hypothetical protein
VRFGELLTESFDAMIALLPFAIEDGQARLFPGNLRAY